MKWNRVTRTGVALGLTIAVWVAIHMAGRGTSRRETLPPPSSASIASLIQETYQLDETIEDRFSTRNRFSKGREVLHLETIADIDSDSAETLIEDGIMGIRALYANALSAYPENLSREVDTPAQFRPEFFQRIINGVTYRYFLLYATERLTYGAVSHDTARLRSLTGWIYCKEQLKLYKLQIFAPLDTPPRTLEDYFTALPCHPG